MTYDIRLTHNETTYTYLVRPLHGEGAVLDAVLPPETLQGEDVGEARGEESAARLLDLLYTRRERAEPPSWNRARLVVQKRRTIISKQ